MNIPTQPANSFTFLRLMLAILVVFGHSFVLGGFGEEPLGRWSNGTTTGRELAVQGFFILSGFLLAQSLTRQPSLARFAARRAFRILPGYWVALLVTSLIVIPAMYAYFFPGRLSYMQSLLLSDYNAVHYLERNSLLWQGQKWILPFFQQNPASGIVNGSLWSLFYEALCYACLGLGAWLCRRGLARRRTTVMCVFFTLYAAGCHRLGFWPYFGLSLGISIAAGALSWILIEKPFIRLGQRFTDRWKAAAKSPTSPVSSVSDQMLFAASHRAG